MQRLRRRFTAEDRPMANVSHTLILYHSGSKDELWRQMAKFAFGSLLTETVSVEQVSRGLAGLDRLRMLVRTLCRFTARFPHHIGFFIAESRSGSQRFEWFTDTYLRSFYEPMNRVLDDAEAQGAIRPIMRQNFVSIRGEGSFSLSASTRTCRATRPCRISPTTRPPLSSISC